MGNKGDMLDFSDKPGPIQLNSRQTLRRSCLRLFELFELQIWNCLVSFVLQSLSLPYVFRTSPMNILQCQ